jgi:hypothetical protein
VGIIFSSRVLCTSRRLYAVDTSVFARPHPQPHYFDTNGGRVSGPVRIQEQNRTGERTPWTICAARSRTPPAPARRTESDSIQRTQPWLPGLCVQRNDTPTGILDLTYFVSWLGGMELQSADLDTCGAGRCGTWSGLAQLRSVVRDHAFMHAVRADAAHLGHVHPRGSWADRVLRLPSIFEAISRGQARHQSGSRLDVPHNLASTVGLCGWNARPWLVGFDGRPCRMHSLDRGETHWELGKGSASPLAIRCGLVGARGPEPPFSWRGRVWG